MKRRQTRQVDGNVVVDLWRAAQMLGDAPRQAADKSGGRRFFAVKATAQRRFIAIGETNTRDRLPFPDKARKRRAQREKEQTSAPP